MNGFTWFQKKWFCCIQDPPTHSWEGHPSVVVSASTEGHIVLYNQKLHQIFTLTKMGAQGQWMVCAAWVYFFSVLCKIELWREKKEKKKKKIVVSIYVLSDVVIILEANLFLSFYLDCAINLQIYACDIFLLFNLFSLLLSCNVLLLSIVS